MKLTVLIPCYNERGSLAEVVAEVRRTPVPDLEIIVVDDGSVDGTRELLAGPLRQQIDQVILHDVNRGKGAALRTGFRAARGDLLVVQDADREYSPAEYPRLLQPILDGKADVVYGSRFSGGEAHRVVYFWHMVANRLLTLASNMLTNLNLTDMETGCKVFRREVLRGLEIEERGFGIEPELTAKLARRKCVFYEVGISYDGRTYEDGKKIGWRDAFRALYAIAKYNLRPLPATEKSRQHSVVRAGSAVPALPGAAVRAGEIPARPG